LFIFNALKDFADGLGFACCLSDQHEETVIMAAVENILVNNTATRNDANRALPKVPFAPFLVFEMETRISDLAAPRPALPANTDNLEQRPREIETPREFETPRDNHVDRGSDRSQERLASRDTASPAADRGGVDAPMPRGGETDRTESVTDGSTKQPPSEPAARTKTDASDPGHDVRESKHVESSTPASDTANGPAAHRPKDGAVGDPADPTEPTNPAKPTKPTNPDVAVASPGIVVAQAGTSVAATPDAAAPLVPVAAPASDGSSGKTNARPGPQGTILPLNAAAGAGATPGTAPAQTPAGSNPGGEATTQKPAGKIELAGMTPSNDDTPSKIGSNVPQVVRDVQTIVARPTNAAGGNLVQAQQQGEPVLAQAQNTPAQPSSAAPPTQNAGQAAPLHVGADGGHNGGQGGGNASGQNSGGANGQQSGGQAGNNPAGSANGQIAGAPLDPAATATQQAAQNFQETLARGSGPGGARGPASSVGDVASTARADAPTASAAGTPATLSSNPASRIASASAPHRPPTSAATEQVSVRLKKAVENGDTKLRIQLRPHELGRVEVKLDIAGDGRAKALILAERPETLELLQRDSRILERALQDAGLKTDQNALSFDLKGRDGEERAQLAQQGKENGGGLDGEVDADGEIDPNEQPIPATAIGLAPDGSINFLA
jgi:flagellar hook-length control protein FliK